MAKKLKSIIVTVADDALKDIHQLAANLAAKGMKVDSVMPVMGVISGSASSAEMSALKKVDGVTSVEEEVTAQLPPPDSTVQ